MLQRTLSSARKKRWPKVEEMAPLGVNDVIEEHSEELTAEEVKDLKTRQHVEVLQETGGAERTGEVILASEIQRCWECARNFQTLFKRNTQTGAMELLDDTCLTRFRNILKGRMEHTSLDRFSLQMKVRETWRKGQNKRIRFRYSLQPFSSASVSIFRSFDLRGKCCTLYFIKTLYCSTFYCIVFYTLFIIYKYIFRFKNI